MAILFVFSMTVCYPYRLSKDDEGGLPDAFKSISYPEAVSFPDSAPATGGWPSGVGWAGCSDWRRVWLWLSGPGFEAPGASLVFSFDFLGPLLGAEVEVQQRRQVGPCAAPPFPMSAHHTHAHTYTHTDTRTSPRLAPLALVVIDRDRACLPSP